MPNSDHTKQGNAVTKRAYLLRFLIIVYSFTISALRIYGNTVPGIQEESWWMGVETINLFD